MRKENNEVYAEFRVNFLSENMCNNCWFGHTLYWRQTLFCAIQWSRLRCGGGRRRRRRKSERRRKRRTSRMTCHRRRGTPPSPASELPATTHRVAIATLTIKLHITSNRTVLYALKATSKFVCCDTNRLNRFFLKIHEYYIINFLFYSFGMNDLRWRTCTSRTCTILALLVVKVIFRFCLLSIDCFPKIL